MYSMHVVEGGKEVKYPANNWSVLSLMYCLTACLQSITRHATAVLQSRQAA